MEKLCECGSVAVKKSMCTKCYMRDYNKKNKEKDITELIRKCDELLENEDKGLVGYISSFKEKFTILLNQYIRLSKSSSESAIKDAIQKYLNLRELKRAKTELKISNYNL